MQFVISQNEIDNESLHSQEINNERKASHNSDCQTQLQINRNTIQEPMEVANCFNDFFATIAQRALQNNQANTTLPLAIAYIRLM